MAFRNGQCTGQTKKGQCSVGAMDKQNRLCGPHLTQALNKAVKAFETLSHPEATQYAQLAQAMIDDFGMSPDVNFLRDMYRKLR